MIRNTYQISLYCFVVTWWTRISYDVFRPNISQLTQAGNRCQYFSPWPSTLLVCFWDPAMGWSAHGSITWEVTFRLRMLLMDNNRYSRSDLPVANKPQSDWKHTASVPVWEKCTLFETCHNLNNKLNDPEHLTAWQCLNSTWCYFFSQASLPAIKAVPTTYLLQCLLSK